MTTESVLQEAERLINGDRQATYGKAITSFERIADLWSAYIGGVSLTAMDVANLMALLKISRAKSALDTPEVIHRDSYVDLAGYAALAVRCHEEILEAQAAPLESGGDSEPTWVPREWWSLHDVPKGVVVSDRDGDQLRWEDGTLQYKARGRGGFGGDNAKAIEFLDRYAPFTEVLDG